MEQINFKDDVHIDENFLDLECLRQPELMLKYGRYVAGIADRVELAKESVNLAKAAADDKIRQDPGKYKIDKITEATVASAILRTKTYQEAFKEYLTLKHELDDARAALTSIDQRRNMLELLVKLHGQQYFAGPRIPHDLSAEVQRKSAARQSNKIVSKRSKSLKRVRNK